MDTMTIGRLTLHVEPGAEDPTRYRWVIRDRDRILRVAAYAMPDAASAQAQGRAAMTEAAALRRDAEAASTEPA